MRNDCIKKLMRQCSLHLGLCIAFYFPSVTGQLEQYRRKGFKSFQDLISNRKDKLRGYISTVNSKVNLQIDGNN